MYYGPLGIQQKWDCGKLQMHLTTLSDEQLALSAVWQLGVWGKIDPKVEIATWDSNTKLFLIQSQNKS